jgi:hypothetical protein
MGQGRAVVVVSAGQNVGRYAPRMMVQDYGIKPQIADNMIETWLMNGVLSVENARYRHETQGA